MNRSVKISLSQASAIKLGRLQALRRGVLSATNFYISSIWDAPGALDAKTLNRLLNKTLSYRHKQNALKTAIEIVIATKKAARILGVKATKPVLKGSVTLSSLVAKIEKGKKSFDFILKVSSLKKYHRPNGLHNYSSRGNYCFVF
jgi:hypothetical protein